MASETMPLEVWDRVVEDLEHQGGVAVVEIPPSVQEAHARAFQVAREALDDNFHGGCQTIPPDADSAHVTGYHPPEGMSRYNAYREGFVFSDGKITGDKLFQDPMKEMFTSLHHGIAQNVLFALERRWKLPVNWFQSELGPTENHSQWHIKRYVFPENHNHAPSEDSVVLLPVHTDPSLISVVVHDHEGQGARGLQYQSPKTREWIDVPVTGSVVATIFVGSVLAYITGSTIMAAKHRVIQVADDSNVRRMAATLFVRPRASAILQVPPSPRFSDVTLKKQTTFYSWSARVSRNYMKRRDKAPPS